MQQAHANGPSVSVAPKPRWSAQIMKTASRRGHAPPNGASSATGIAASEPERHPGQEEDERRRHAVAQRAGERRRGVADVEHVVNGRPVLPRGAGLVDEVEEVDRRELEEHDGRDQRDVRRSCAGESASPRSLRSAAEASRRRFIDATSASIEKRSPSGRKHVQSKSRFWTM